MLENKIMVKKERREQERLRRWMDGERREGRDGEREASVEHGEERKPE